MALRKTVTIQGEKYIATSSSRYPLGESTYSFDALIHVLDVVARKTASIATVEFKDTNGIGYQKQYSFDTDVSDNSVNSICQAYKHLKTLDEFANSVDC